MPELEDLAEDVEMEYFPPVAALTSGSAAILQLWPLLQQLLQHFFVLP